MKTQIRLWLIFSEETKNKIDIPIGSMALSLFLWVFTLYVPKQNKITCL